ncbi:ATP-binding protein [Alkalinema sp. FACHB-956]|uniref:ATP-binding protein n=1 Tax=Alkalinema sp. FACHB-956 TaxID=2692768 RepID=UPI001682366C|nr:ATP-binding protein [Alkalinema sp. FACHB-956]MBD2325820.1 response regulator [Alkalinema sp. FACHB-956]
MAQLSPTTAYYLRKLLRQNWERLRSIVRHGAALEADPLGDLNQVLESLYLEPEEVTRAVQELERLTLAHQALAARPGGYGLDLQKLEAQIFWLLGYKFQSTVNQGLILIITADPESLRSLAQALVRKEYSVEMMSQSLTQAIELVQMKRPRLILTDMTLPDSRGHQICKRLQDLEAGCDIPVMVIGGAQTLSEKLRALEGGVVDYLVQPLQQEEVLARVAYHLKVSNLLRTLTAQNLQFHQELRQSQEEGNTYRAMFEQSVDGMFQSSWEGQYLRVNSALARLYGYDSPEELLATVTNIQEQLYVQPDRREELMAYLSVQDQVTEFESQIYCKDGCCIWISEDVRAVRGEAGQLLFHEGVVRNIDDRKRLDQRLALQHQVTQMLAANPTQHQANQYLLTAIATCLGWPLGELWMVEPENHQLHCVQTWQRSSEGEVAFLAEAQVLHLSIGEGFPGCVAEGNEPIWVADVTQLPKLRRLALARQASIQSAVGFPILQGPQVLGVVAFYAQALVELDANLMQMVATIVQQFGQFVERKQAETALRRSEIQLRQKTQQLETTLRHLQQTQVKLIQQEKMSSLGQLVAGISHELNNPISFIYSNLVYAEDYIQDLISVVKIYRSHYPESIPELAEADALDINFLLQDFPKLLKSIQTGSQRIRNIVSALRSFARLDEVGEKPTQLNQALETIMMLLGARLAETAQRPAIQVVRQYDPALPVVPCDPGQMNQVLMILILNAIEAIDRYWVEERPDREPTIRLQTVAQGKTLQVCIGDNGPGIPPELHQRIFDPFFTTKPVGQGTGMGLPIAYQILEHHHGKLEFQSQWGQGAEFIVTLPVVEGGEGGVEEA